MCFDITKRLINQHHKIEKKKNTGLEQQEITQEISVKVTKIVAWLKKILASAFYILTEDCNVDLISTGKLYEKHVLKEGLQVDKLLRLTA